MIDSMKVKRSIYFATLQGYVIFETELYNIRLSCFPTEITNSSIQINGNESLFQTDWLGLYKKYNVQQNDPQILKIIVRRICNIFAHFATFFENYKCSMNYFNTIEK